MIDPMHDGLALQIHQLYQRLIRLESAPSFNAALREVLQLLAGVAQCELVCVEIGDYWLGHAVYALAPGVLRARISRALFERALHEGVTVTANVSGAAARWREGSVALCTPIGGELPVGVLYAESAEPLVSVERAYVESVAYQLAAVYPTALRGRAPLADQLRALKERRIREAMERHLTIADAARDLRVSRALVYRVLGVTGRDT
jgi:hypothetical protein